MDNNQIYKIIYSESFAITIIGGLVVGVIIIFLEKIFNKSRDHKINQLIDIISENYKKTTMPNEINNTNSPGSINTINQTGGTNVVNIGQETRTINNEFKKILLDEIKKLLSQKQRKVNLGITNTADGETAALYQQIKTFLEESGIGLVDGMTTFYTSNPIFGVKINIVDPNVIAIMVGPKES